MAEMKKYYKDEYPALPIRLLPTLASIKTDLKDIGIRSVQIHWQPVKGTELHRFLVISPDFSKVRNAERQELVWRVVEKSLPKEQYLQVLSMLTLTVKEASELDPTSEYVNISSYVDDYIKGTEPRKKEQARRKKAS